MTTLLPLRVRDNLCRSLKASPFGNPSHSVEMVNLLDAALEPIERRICTAVAPCEVLPDKRLRLTLGVHRDYRHPHLDVGRLSIAAEFEPKTGRWMSEVEAGHASLARFLSHCWFVKTNQRVDPEVALLAHIGLAFLQARQERA